MTEQKPNVRAIINARFHNPKFIYDGKRMRKSISRRVVDYATAYVRKRFVDDAPFIPTHQGAHYANWSIGLLPVSAYVRNLELALPRSLIHTAINKVRCQINVVRWSPDGRRLITGTSSGEFTLWNGFSYHFETILQAHEAPVRSLAWSYNGKYLLSGDHQGTLKYWQPSMNNINIIQAHMEAVRDISFSPTDCKFVTSSDDGTLKIWDMKEAKEERKLCGHGWDVRIGQWHPNMALIASGSKDNLIKLWDPRSDSELRTLHQHKNTILCLTWTSDGYGILSGGKDQIAKLFDIRMMRDMRTYKGHVKEVTAVRTNPLLPDVFVTGSAEGTVYFWHLNSSECIGTIDSAHDSTIWSLDFHPAGHVLTTSSVDNTTRFWVRQRPGESVKIRTDQDQEETEDEQLEEPESAIPGL